ncbi:hypothetical protein M1523_04550 [Patescibacteria group bacterium]|nr:hypothetical protein [Patescibacteria group bacterium]MCL5091507.1 hypothetical protein [Patescibacteria group bacterium]
MEIIPALLEPTPTALVHQINRLAPFFSRFQIDIADGVYVTNTTVTVAEALTAIANPRPGAASPVSFDLHLMVKDYETQLKTVERLSRRIKINAVLIHASLSPDYPRLARQFSFPIGLVINPNASIKQLDKHYALSNLPVIQVMSIFPGRQGQTFIPETLNKIEQLRRIGYRNKIFLDGGINDRTLPLICQHRDWPDALCIGSYLARSNDIAGTLDRLKTQLGRASPPNQFLP